MEQQIVEIPAGQEGTRNTEWIAALEAGKVLYLPHAPFVFTDAEKKLLTPDVRDPKSRNISFGPDNRLKGGAGDEATLALMAAMMERFRTQAEALLATLAPKYTESLERGAISYRPSVVEDRVQSWRADDKRLHVDAFPSRPNRGQRLLRVFSNVNPAGVPRVWRVGQPFEDVARHFLPRVKPYSAWQASLMKTLGITKSLRSEYDHLMLQLHDAMKSDEDYQKTAPQVTFGFPPGSTWVVFSDQASHAAMSGQFMMEHTLQLAPSKQYHPEASPLAILTRLQGHAIV